MAMWLLAVDFGTSNTAAAHTSARGGEITTLGLSHQSQVMPSGVFVEAPDSILTGDVARDRAQSDPSAFVGSPKRLVGHGTVRAGHWDVPDRALVAAVLNTVLQKAITAHDGEPPGRLVLTHPEAWSPAQLQVLRDAAQLVGYDTDRLVLVSEPRAAAHFYTRTGRLDHRDRIAVFDFGGGTLDVAVLEVDQDSFRVVAARGDNRLGGKNLDATVRRWLDHQLDDRNPELVHALRSGAGPAAAADPMMIGAVAAVDDSVRRAKELLSEAPSATLVAAVHGSRESVLLTRGELEDLIAAHIERAVALTWQTFRDAGVAGPNDLRSLYLTGGSSRIPLVHQRLAALGPVATLDDPKTVVVRGALDTVEPLDAPTVPRELVRPVSLFGDTLPRQLPVSTSRTSSRRWVIVGAGLAAAVAVGGTFLAVRGTGSDDQAAADSTSSSTAAADVQSKDSATVTAVIPPALETASDCAQSGFTSNGALKVVCWLVADGRIGADISVSEEPRISYTAWVDTTDATTRLREWDSDADRLAPGSSAISGALIDDTRPTLVTVTYADAESGLIISMPSIRSRDAALTFLQRSTLI